MLLDRFMALAAPGTGRCRRTGALPRGRINAQLAMIGNVMYVFGGMFEKKDAQYTLNDLWCLDIAKLDKWRCVLEGVAIEGISDAQTLEEILTGYIDMGEVEVLQISDRSSGASREWLRFYCGDTEVGFIYNGTTLEAIVGDGDINLQQ